MYKYSFLLVIYLIFCILPISKILAIDNFPRGEKKLTKLGNHLSPYLREAFSSKLQSFDDNDTVENSWKIVAFYEKFGDLLPPSKIDKISAVYLSEHMIRLDLLEKAAELLEKVSKNPSYSKDIDLAIFLVSVYLSDNRLIASLEHLEKVNMKRISRENKLAIMLMKTNCLIRIGKYKKAEELIGEIDKISSSEISRKMKVDILWRNSKWDDFILMAEDIISRFDTDHHDILDNNMNFLYRNSDKVIRGLADYNHGDIKRLKLQLLGAYLLRNYDKVETVENIKYDIRRYNAMIEFLRSSLLLGNVTRLDYK